MLVLPGGPVSIGVFKADEIYEISHFHNLVHFIQKFGGDALLLICCFDRPNPPQ
jgi:hypothetical protein